jgi:hypothetical protein
VRKTTRLKRRLIDGVERHLAAAGLVPTAPPTKATLFISEKTAGVHMSNSLAKLFASGGHGR